VASQPSKTPTPSPGQSSCPTSDPRSAPAASALTLAEASNRVGSDIDRSLTLVTREIGFEAYRGALRGDQGALDAGAGNAVDKSLLLASLLEDAGHETRFAFGRLAEQRQSELACASIATDPALRLITCAGACDPRRRAYTDNLIVYADGVRS
jgi:transglutaminase-like putative cysteine protease